MNQTELIQKLINLAGEALYLAEEYSGGESDTAQELTKQLEKLEKVAYQIEVSNTEFLEAMKYLLEDHKRMFPEAHPHSTIQWEDCEEVKKAKAAIKKYK